MGIALAYTFTSVLYADSFYRYRAFYSERTRAQLWHYSYTSFFHTTLALPNLRALRMRTKNTFLAVPTCYIGLKSCSVWLFNTLFNRSKANRRIFDFPSLKNRFPTKRAFCFSLSAVFAFLFFNSVFYYLFFYSFFSVLVCRLFGFRVHDYYKTVFQNCKTF